MSETMSEQNRGHGHTQQRVHKALLSLKNVRWIGSIMHLLDRGASGNMSSLDLCQLIGKSTKELGIPKAKAPIQFQRPHRLYFDTAKFPPPTATVDGRLPAPCESFNNLKIALESAGNAYGSPLICNGSYNGRNRVFMCGLKYVQ